MRIELREYLEECMEEAKKAQGFSMKSQLVRNTYTSMVRRLNVNGFIIFMVVKTTKQAMVRPLVDRGQLLRHFDCNILIVN